MKRTLLSLLVLGLFGSVGLSAFAADPKADMQPSADAPKKTPPAGTTAKPAAPVVSAINSSQVSADFKAAEDRARTDYTDAKLKCDTLQAGDKRSCMKEARSARTEALALAKTHRDHPGDAKGETEKRGGTATMQTRPEATPAK
ncbi:MAG: hypothetical protein ABI771_10710 [Betaproteobacteria bacterium]